MISVILIMKICDFLSVFFYLSVLILKKIKYFYRIILFIVSFALNDCDFGERRNHTDHYGSLHSQENVISCYYFGIDVTFGQSTNSRPCISFELIDKCDNSQDVYI